MVSTHFEKYARQIGNLPQILGENLQIFYSCHQPAMYSRWSFPMSDPVSTKSLSYKQPKIGMICQELGDIYRTSARMLHFFVHVLKPVHWAICSSYICVNLFSKVLEHCYIYITSIVGYQVSTVVMTSKIFDRITVGKTYRTYTSFGYSQTWGSTLFRFSYTKPPPFVFPSNSFRSAPVQCLWSPSSPNHSCGFDPVFACNQKR